MQEEEKRRKEREEEKRNPMTALHEIHCLSKMLAHLLKVRPKCESFRKRDTDV